MTRYAGQSPLLDVIHDKRCYRSLSLNMIAIRRKLLVVKSLVNTVVVVLLCVSTVAQEPKQVSLDEARQLVTAGLPSKTTHLPKFGLEEYQRKPSLDFYFFTAYWAGATNGSMVVGTYAVDRSTADVWNDAAACLELSTPALRKLQAQVRSRIGLSTAEYRKKKRRCPLEMEDAAGAS